jgi:DNA invertase Pin-like site-specific DNA recombinase
MKESLKVQPHHLERSAYLYIRQSSMRQVIENTESTKRQYALRGRASALGWRDEQIIVIDCDQGESGVWRDDLDERCATIKMEIGLRSVEIMPVLIVADKGYVSA